MDKILIIEANTEKACEKIEEYKALRYSELFKKLIKTLGDYKIDIICPMFKNFVLPSVKDLEKYKAIIITGSVLSVNSAEVKIQEILCEKSFKSKTPIYGSCFGLQLAVKVAGGEIYSDKSLYEIGILKNLQLTKEGETHFLYNNINTKSFCTHKDFVKKLPLNSSILAFNDFCKVQALEILYMGGRFVGVQYHPEFDQKQMISTYYRLKNILLKNKHFKNEKEFIEEIKRIQDFEINVERNEIKNFLESLYES